MELLSHKIEKNQEKRDKYDFHRIVVFTIFGVFMEDKDERYKKFNECNMQLVKKSLGEGIDDIKNKFIKIYMLDCAVWSQHLQPIYVNILNIGWNTFLCYTQQESH